MQVDVLGNRLPQTNSILSGRSNPIGGTSPTPVMKIKMSPSYTPVASGVSKKNHKIIMTT